MYDVFDRLPVYQGPTSAYVIAVLTLETLPAWQCPDYWEYIGQKGMKLIQTRLNYSVGIRI